MKRIPALVAVTLAMMGCGSDNDNRPSVSQVTVTVRQGGATVPNTVVQASTAANSSSDLGQIIDSASTDSSGQVTFTVPASTSTNNLCFSSYIPSGTGGSFAADCSSLNSLTSSVALDHL